MRNSKLTPVILLLPLMAVTLTVIIACVNVLLQSIGYVPAFGLTKITLGYYREVFKRPEFLSALWVSLRIAFVSTLLAAALEARFGLSAASASILRTEFLTADKQKFQ